MTVESTRDSYALPWVLPWAASRFYQTPFIGTLTTNSLVATRIYAMAFYVPNPAGVTLASIGVEVTAAGTAGHIARFALYTNNNGHPQDLILDAGTATIDATGYRSATISQFLPQGWVWGTFVKDASATFRAFASGNHAYLLYHGSPDASVNNPMMCQITQGTVSMDVYRTQGMPEVWQANVSGFGGPTHDFVPRLLLGT